VLARTVTHALVGLDPRRVEVEAHLQSGAPAFAIVGLADRACQEAKERVRSGIASAALEWPSKQRITVNLAPAGLRKEGSGFDLPIALAVLAASQQLPGGCLADHAAVGELALDGRLRPVPGALVAAEGARRSGLSRLVCAAESGPEVALAGVEPVPVRHLAEAVSYFRRGSDPPACAPPPRDSRTAAVFDLADVRGQGRARRALEIAAAGSHNVLFAGPPGIGKTMLAQRLPGILPPLEDEAALEVTRIHSVAGLLAAGSGLVRTPPFRAPHHTASTAAIVGGGSSPRPGEATLAHHGVLFLDELPEFQRPVLEALRQPLEDGVISVVRVGGRSVFPARFRLVGTMNLCPCGGRGDARAECSCSPQRIDRYREKLSRALLDRFDLVVPVPRPRATELAAPPGEPSAEVRERVVLARGRLESTELARSPAADEMLARAVERLPLSGRGRARVARVARTVAALAGATEVAGEHLAEALSYRSPSELGAR
jgi:magnesium chelatase family protein